jgi:hypothetical protein
VIAVPDVADKPQRALLKPPREFVDKMTADLP